MENNKNLRKVIGKLRSQLSEKQILSCVLKELYPIAERHTGTVTIILNDGGIRKVSIEIVR